MTPPPLPSLSSTFAQKYLADFDEAQLKEYDTILNEHDNEWDMYAWYTERVVCFSLTLSPSSPLHNSSST